MTRPPELFTRSDANPILTAADVPYPANSVFNPGAARLADETVLLLRVEDLRGISQLHVARSVDGVSDWRFDPEPLLRSEEDQHPEEIWGCEDPRLTWLPEREEWAIAYTAYSRRGPLVSLAVTKDFRTVRRLGPVMPPEDKDAALFPGRFDGRWAMIHRPSPLRGGAHMWISFSPDLRHWGDHTLLLEARDGAWWDAGKIGLGPPPLETPEGWLVMYHGVHLTSDGPIYRMGLVLLDLDDPRDRAPPDGRMAVRARGAIRDHRRRRPGRLPVRLGPRCPERSAAPVLRRRRHGRRSRHGPLQRGPRARLRVADARPNDGRPTTPTRASSTSGCSGHATGYLRSEMPRDPSIPDAFDVYTMELLRRPDDAPELPDDELDALQSRHLAYRAKLRSDGLLVANGPLEEQSDPSLRGLSIFACDLAEARRLSDLDPSVQAGRLAYDAFEWWMAAGTLAFPGIAHAVGERRAMPDD